MINLDFKDKKSFQSRKPTEITQDLFLKDKISPRFLMGSFGLLAIFIAIFYQSNPALNESRNTPYLSNVTASIHLESHDTKTHVGKVDDLINGSVQSAPLPEPVKSSLLSKLVVKPGDSLARMFSRAGLSPKDLHEIMNLGESTAMLKKIHVGDVIQYSTDSTGRLNSLIYEIDETDALIVELLDNQYQAHMQSKPIEIRHEFASAVITSSLFNAGLEAGMSNRLVIELANIFQWDIDFVLDIRRNDRFSVVFEKRYVDGELIGNGNIVAAQFVNQGHTFTAVRYEDSKGDVSYYSPDGKSMRKAFLRAPLNFSRISGNFSLTRKHPILNRIRAHRGVDYAAPTGTPIRASGDGKIHFAGNKGGFGKLIVVNHGQSYQSKYAHLSRYARGIRSGKHVKQGQIIGYVGKSGLATGPHLHYEFLVNGVHRNPRTVKLPNARPIAESELARFKKHTQDLLAHLEVKERIFLAQLSSNSDG